VNEPLWLTRIALDAMQESQCQEHGGSRGPLNEHLIESALARPRNQYAYAGADLFACAAAYIYGIAKNHGYRDANKRTGYVAGLTFLRMNGVRAQAPAQAVVDLMLDVATDQCDESHIADWLRRHTV
jgi:death-on-curing protein